MTNDQYYSTDQMAQWVVATIAGLLPQDHYYLEPSAGDGVFLPYIMPAEAFDTDPRHPAVVRADFMATVRPHCPRRVVIGNPPYGKRSDLAIRFVNHAASMADTIAFILPPSFNKWSVQRAIDWSLRLALTTPVPWTTYRTPDGRPVEGHRRVLQVWAAGPGPDHRMRKAPPTTHPDFKMWQYNCTPAALTAFDEDFDFAVPRQGFLGYDRRETDPANCEKSKQWMLIKAATPAVLERLMGIDYAELANLNSAVPGFGKADLVMHYNSLNTGDTK